MQTTTHLSILDRMPAPASPVEQKSKKAKPVKVDDSPVKRPRGPFVHWPYVPSMFNIVGLVAGLLIAYLITSTIVLPFFEARKIVGWGSFASTLVFIVLGLLGLCIMWTISRALRRAFPVPAVKASTQEHSAPRET
jgi:uncharacterized protein YacL